MRQHSEKLADGPHHYVASPDLGDAIRICAHGNYLIVFEPFKEIRAKGREDWLKLRNQHTAENVRDPQYGYSIFEFSVPNSLSYIPTDIRERVPMKIKVDSRLRSQEIIEWE